LLFVVTAVTQISLREISAEILLFLGGLVVALGMIVFVPGIVLFRPVWPDTRVETGRSSGGPGLTERSFKKII